MKAVILAGGLGTRLREVTEVKPKPLVEIGGQPILWHILKIYSHYGITDFIICLGYKGYLIKEYFANYSLHMSDVTFDMTTGQLEVHQNNSEPWRVTLVDTGDHPDRRAHQAHRTSSEGRREFLSLPMVMAWPISTSPGPSNSIAAMAVLRPSARCARRRASVPSKWTPPIT